MFFAWAFFARRTPTAFAPSAPLGDFALKPSSRVEAETRVTPFTSSTSCAYIFAFERKIERRGWEAVPSIFARIRRLRLNRICCLLLVVRRILVAIIHLLNRALLSASSLTLLTDNVLIRVLNTLALVRLRRLEATDFRRDHTDQHFIGAAHSDVSVSIHFRGDSGRKFIVDLVRVTDVQRQRLTFRSRTITDTDDVEFFRETGRRAVNHVRDQRAGQTVQSGRLRGHRFLPFDDDVVLVDLRRHTARDLMGKLP